MSVYGEIDVGVAFVTESELGTVNAGEPLKKLAQRQEQIEF